MTKNFNVSEFEKFRYNRGESGERNSPLCRKTGRPKADRQKPRVSGEHSSRARRASDYVLGIDIGGTKIVFVLLKGRKVVKTKKINTPKNMKELIKVLMENVNNLKGSSKIEGIGIGVAGALDKKREKILNSPNLKYLNNFPLVKVLAKKLKLKVMMENDANCFTLGEAVLGAGKNKKVVFGITLGSGVGGGLVIDSKIYQGAFGGAGEIGHTIIKFDGLKCGCGNSGCFEVYGSKKFFERKKISSKKLEEKATKGEKRAKEIFKEYGKYLGIGIANIVNLLDPDVVIIGGGISKAQRHFLKTAKNEAEKRILSPLSKKNLRVRPAELKDKGGAVGAALLLMAL